MDYDDLREEAEESAMENEEFVWKSRIVEAVQRKVAGLRWCHSQLGITDNTEIQKLVRKIKHLEQWLQDFLEEEMAAIREDNMDPYTLRGLRRSDF
jgi:uncharacterized coiled-coil DUF342 family protein